MCKNKQNAIDFFNHNFKANISKILNRHSTNIELSQLLIFYFKTLFIRFSMIICLYNLIKFVSIYNISIIICTLNILNIYIINTLYTYTMYGFFVHNK